MATFPKQILTGKGLALEVKTAKGVVLNISRIGLGAGVIGETPISTLNRLIDEKVSLPINTYKQSENQYTLESILSNSEPLFIGFYWREIGVYANDPDEGEILYSYANAGNAGDTIPSYGQTPFVKHIYLTTKIDNASTVSVNVINTPYQSRTVNVTIPSSYWQGITAPFTATLSVIGVTGTSANELLPNLSDVADVAKNQLKALQSANIIGYSQAKDTITLKAYGDKPSMDLPITVIIRSDL